VIEIIPKMRGLSLVSEQSGRFWGEQLEKGISQMAGYDGPIKDDPKEPCAKTYTWLVDGKEVTVTLTLVDGKVIAKIESEVDMDVNALYWGDDDGKGDFEGFKKKDSSLNMNGEGSQYEGEAVLWDKADKISSPGSKDAGFISAGGTKEFELSMTAEEFEALVYFGIRATSVGEDGEDSLKLVGKPEDCPPEEDDCTDFFPDMDKGISHVTFVWSYDPDKAPEGLTDLDKNGDGYITVKIDIPGSKDDEPADLGECGNDLDTWYKAALADIYASDKYKVLLNADFEGAYIKSGNDAFSPDNDPNIWDGDPGNALNSLAYFSVEDVEGNDNGNDPRPDGMGEEVVTVRGNGTEVTSLTNYTDGHTFAFNQDWIPEECDCVA
jgi:hypothetical protein